MDRETQRSIEKYRRHEAGPIENNLIDELVNGELDRAEFLRRGALFGLSAGVLSSLLGLVGEVPAQAATLGFEAAKKGGILRVGMTTFGGSLEPYKLGEAGAVGLASMLGEHLVFSDLNLRARPWLATSWKANKNATVWTFQLRKGVRFHNGKTLTADDVVATFKVLVGNAQSAGLATFKGVLSPEGVIKKGPYTVEFRLEQPLGAFPYYVSQTTYQAIIQPSAIASRPDTWVSSKMIGTGPFRLVSYTEKRSAVLARFPQYWGGPAPLDGVRVTYYEGTPPMVLALRAGQIHLAQQLSPQQAAPFRGNSSFNVLEAPTAQHRNFCLRVDQDPFRDPRVRRAIALTLDRPDLIRRLLLGRGTLGNDSPLWSHYPSTNPSIHQRKQNVALAKALLAAAGQQSLKFTLTTVRFLEVPDYAATIQAAGRAAGMDISIELQSDDEYYGGPDATTPWLNNPATITSWGARAVPNVYMVAGFRSDGIWNASHYKNAQFDSALTSFLAAIDLQSQRKYTKQLAGILLRDTPVVISYFTSFVMAESSKVKNYVPEGISNVRLAKTSLG
jgi:peptide/nickel transport system substrate-binding protein